MSVEIIQERLAAYKCKSLLEEEQALREITQEIILAALGRTDLFGKAVKTMALHVWDGFHGVARAA